MLKILHFTLRLLFSFCLTGKLNYIRNNHYSHVFCLYVSFSIEKFFLLLNMQFIISSKELTKPLPLLFQIDPLGYKHILESNLSYIIWRIHFVSNEYNSILINYLCIHIHIYIFPYMLLIFTYTYKFNIFIILSLFT